MAQPIPIFTSPSTTLVQVDLSNVQIGYTPVILNTVVFPGQLVTVLNTLSSLDILNSPIVVSTINGAQYADGSFSTLIQQPQGFLTAQTSLPNQWTYLNSYPFRDQYISAGVQSLTTSTLYTALNSTIIDVISSLKVENLFVTSNFFQSSGLILNTSVSSLGAVTILSSLTVNGPAYFSSSVSSYAYTVLGSTLTVGQDFFSRSSLRLESSLTISTSLSVLQDIFLNEDNRQVQLQGGLIANALEVQTSSFVAMDTAGSIMVEDSLTTLSSMNVGKELFLNELVGLGNLSSFSSMVVQENVFVSQDSLFKKDLGIGGTLGIGGSLTIQEFLTLQSTLRTYKHLTVDSLYSLSSLNTSYLGAEKAFIQGNLVVSTSVVSTQNLLLDGSLGFGDIISLSTSIGAGASTLSNLVLSNQAYVQGYTSMVDTLSTIQDFTAGQDVYALENLTVGTSLYVQGSMAVYGKADIADSLQFNLYQANPLTSTVFMQDLSVVSSLSVRDIAIISSITLPSSVLANNFIVSTFTAGHQGIARDIIISTLVTSSITSGGIANTDYAFDMTNVLETQNLSTFQLSSLQLQFGVSSQPSTSIQFTSSLGVAIEAAENTVDVNAIAYTLGETYVGKTISSLQVFATDAQGYFFGDGYLLSNVNYPARISTLVLSTGTLAVERVLVSSLYASSGVIVDSFIPYSTLRIGDFYMYGNAAQDILQDSNNLRSIYGSPNILALNNMYCYGDTASLVQKQVVIHSNLIQNPSATYNLDVEGTLRFNSLISPEFNLYIQKYTGDIVVGVDIGSSATNTLYISTGSIGKDNGVFFLPSYEIPLAYSTNTIQPILSTLIFNSTLIVNRERLATGINTVPFYNLDVHPQTYLQKGVLVNQSTTTGFINVQQQRSTFWMAVTSNDGFSNIVYSSTEGETWDYFTPYNPYAGGTLLNVATNGGQLTFTTSNTLVSEKLWLATGAPLAQVYREGAASWQTITNSSKLPQSNAAVAYNGQVWVLTGYNTGGLSAITFPPLHWSTDGFSWQKATSGGFTWDSSSATYGGRGLAWNGSYWIAVGQGASATNSVLYSGDGRNWSDAVSGGFMLGGQGVVWTGSNWVATGNNGGPLSSFIVSEDGSNWTGISGYGFNSGFGNQSGNAIATDGQLVVAVGPYYSAWPSASIQYSLDSGLNWTNATGDLFNTDGYQGLSIVWNGDYWLAGGTDGVRKSFDGIHWTKPALSPNLMFHGMAFSSNAQPLLQIGASNYTSSFTSTINTFNVACGLEIININSNCLRWSYDGINWSDAVSGYFKEEGRAAAHNGSNLWVAAGKGTASNLIYSGDGKNWSDGIIIDTYSAMARGTSVVYGGGYWVATYDSLGGGDNVIFYSANGQSWRAATAGIQFSQAGWGVAFGNGKFTMVGDNGGGGNTILYAQNLSPPDRWTNSAVTNAFDLIGNAIAYGNGRWIACGTDSTGKNIKYSTDQLSWTDATGVFPVAGYGIDYNGSNRWVAVGDGAGAPLTSNILYSDDDGVTWNNITSGDFSIRGRGVRYNQGLQLWMAAGEDATNKLKYSGDGINWSNATNGFDTAGYGFGVYSNVVSTQTTFINQLRFYNTPGPFVTTRDTTPNVSYTSTSLTLMDTMTIDRFNTVTIQHNPLGYLSSFYDDSAASISTLVSTSATQVAGYFLTTALV